MRRLFGQRFVLGLDKPGLDLLGRCLSELDRGRFSRPVSTCSAAVSASSIRAGSAGASATIGANSSISGISISSCDGSETGSAKPSNSGSASGTGDGIGISFASRRKTAESAVCWRG
jgi:hypothetical protein